jgi:geranylgeranyl reductase family protein
MDADVAIVGTGPGGGMAACRLAGTGLKTILLEQRTLPRPKPCGGAMPARVTQVIDWDFDSLIESRTRTVRNLCDYEQEQIVDTTSPILMVSRPQFDQHLVARALRLSNGGVRLRERFRVTSVEEDAGGITVRSAGESLRVRYLVAADGAHSRIARSLGLNRDPTMGIAMDAEVDVDAAVYEQERTRATFNYFCLPNGYGWIFPKAGHLSCGVGAWRGNIQIRHALDDFLARSFPAGSMRSVRVSAHSIPLYSGDRDIATRRVCLVGDAANLVDPILGEGIRFAMVSGTLAADTIVNAVSGRADAAQFGDCRDYETSIRRHLGAPLGGLYHVISPIFLKAPAFFYRKFVLTGQSYFGLSQQLASKLRAAAAAP